MRLYQDKKWLYRKYHIEKLSISDIVELCGYSQGTIFNWLNKFGIKRRSKSYCAKRRWKNPEYRENQITIRREAAKTPEVKEHLKNMSKSVWNDPQKRRALLAKRKPYKRTDDHNKKMSEILTGRIFSDEHMKNISLAQKRRMQNPDEKKRMQEMRLLGSTKRPTNPEKLFDEMTPSVVRYVGNRAFWRLLPNGKYKNPDFKVTGQNKVIEIYGDYWHRNDDPQELIDLYKQSGLDCLVIWEHEIRKNPSIILNKVNQFLKGSHHVHA